MEVVENLSRDLFDTANRVGEVSDPLGAAPMEIESVLYLSCCNT